VKKGVNTTACGTFNANSNGLFEDDWTVGTDAATPSGCGFSVTDHWQWCELAPNKTFATLNGFTHQLAIEINSVTSPAQMAPGTVIRP
ncbi:MAG: hypothetical protein ACRD1A_02670, partial [Terriglobales bacterium]